LTVAFASLAGANALQMGMMPAVAPAPRAAVSMQASVESLLKDYAGPIDSMGSIAPDMSEIARLRFAMAFPDATEAKSALVETVAWRNGAGKAIVDSAAEAVDKAMAGGGWDNDPVRAAAPFASAINEFVTPKNIISVSTDDGDLVYVIRASAIEDKAMMQKVTPEQLADWFLYVKEVHNIICNMRSEKSGRLCQVIFANDITGTRKAPDPLFAKALTASSKSYEKLYPSLAGPTMILNLPLILQAFVGLFKPLFPKSVQARLKFERAPFLGKNSDISGIASDPNKKRQFLNEIANLLDDGFFGTKGKM